MLLFEYNTFNDESTDCKIELIVSYFITFLKEFCNNVSTI